MNVTLVMVQSDGASKEAPLKMLPAVIGRDEGVRIRIPKPNVSRRHCELAVNDDDELIVRDLKSSNGTYVNGERIGGERELVPGDLLTVGEVVFVVRIDGHPKDIDAADSYAAGSVMLGGTPVEGTPTGPKTQMISGVPAWGGEGGGGGSGGGSGGGGGGGSKQPAGAAPAKPAKKADDDDDDDFSDLLEGLDLGDDDDDDVPMKKKWTRAPEPRASASGSEATCGSSATNVPQAQRRWTPGDTVPVDVARREVTRRLRAAHRRSRFG